MAIKQKCNVCGKQMHPRHTTTQDERKTYYGKNQDLKAYTCPLGHTKYVKMVVE